MTRESEIGTGQLPDGRIITRSFDRPELFRLLSEIFAPGEAIHALTDFQDKTTGFVYNSPEGPVWTEINLAPEAVRDRIETICGLLTALSVRDAGGKPDFTRDEAFNAFSVIATNWLSIHGALGVDGHGRSLMRLYILSMQAAGYSREARRAQFYLEYPDKLNIDKALHFLFYLNGHFKAGHRIWAAYNFLGRTGEVPPELLSPMAIFDRTRRRGAEKSAADITSRKALILIGLLDPLRSR